MKSSVPVTKAEKEDSVKLPILFIYLFLIFNFCNIFSLSHWKAKRSAIHLGLTCTDTLGVGKFNQKNLWYLFNLLPKTIK